MELFLLKPVEYNELYNCSFYDIDFIPLQRRQNIALGMIFFMMGTFQFLLYIPCMMAIWKHMENPCYKMMFYIGLLDMASLPVNSIGTGLLGMAGAVFCSYPSVIYVMGVFGFALWCAESSVEIFLALNRCIEICSPRYADILFRGWRTWLWVVPPSLYGFHAAWDTMPVLFSGLYFTWFFNPHVGYFDDFGKIYHNYVQVGHNWLVVIGLTGTYFTFAFILMAKTYKYKGQGASGTASFSQKMIFLQVVLISLMNILAAMIYVYMQYYRISEFLMILAQFAWLQANGIPPLIYLAMNKTIRRDCGDMMLKLLFGIDRNAHTRVKVLKVTGTAEHQNRHAQSTINNHSLNNANSSGKLNETNMNQESTQNHHLQDFEM